MILSIKQIFLDFFSRSQLYIKLLRIMIVMWFHGVVVITSALHAEGREFEPRWNLTFLKSITSMHRRLGQG